MSTLVASTIPNPGNVVLIQKKECDQMVRARQNEMYIAKIDQRIKRLNKGEGIHKTMDELKAMEDE